MNRNILLLSLVISLLAGGSALYIAGKPGWVASWSLGTLLGIYPFFFFYITRNLYYGKSGKINGILLWAILIMKFIATALVILLLGNLRFIVSAPFIIGFLIMAPIILTIVLINNLTNKQASYGK
ncbi:MAG: hypothetical protein HZA49_00240 [Planctomycetes bacterium]|nr:hypothetical protein [Planctomycetota bacterium]